MKQFLLAFDLGTTGNKAALVETGNGQVIAVSSSPYPTYYTSDGGAEQAPDDWWASVVQCCASLQGTAPEAFRQVAAIGCSGMMNGAVFISRNGSLLHPAIIHADTRSADLCRQLESDVGRGAIYAATSNRLDPHLTFPKVVWFQQKRPDLLKRADYVIQAKDYLAGRLTGRWGITDPSDASLTGVYSVKARAWAADLWREAGLRDSLLPSVVESTEIVGAVSEAAARATGLRAGIPVVAGGGDGPCASAGSGAATGDAYNYLGGSSWIGQVRDSPIDDDRLSSYCALDNRVITFGTVQAAGTAIAWFLNLFAGSEIDLRGLDIESAGVPPGSDNLFFLPYLQGERAPLWDPVARGVFFGLGTHHTRAHLFRSILEGTASALRSIYDVFAEDGSPLDDVRILGGGAHSRLWLQIISALCGKTLRVVDDNESATAMGAAMAAGVGVGAYDSIRSASAMVAYKQSIVPEPGLTALYAPRYALFRTLYPLLEQRFEALSRL